MFRGISLVVLDVKGRIALPVRYRERLTQHECKQVVITIDTESPCLLLYPLREWEQIEAKLNALPSFNPVTRRIQRLLIGHATELEFDNNGRILLPSLLRDYAKLGKKVMLVGQSKKIELWDEATWNAKRSDWLLEGLQASELSGELGSLAL